MSAVMAAQPGLPFSRASVLVPLVMGSKGNVTVGTLYHIPAASAGYEASVAPSVKKEHYLLPAKKTILDQLLQFS